MPGFRGQRVLGLMLVAVGVAYPGAAVAADRTPATAAIRSTGTGDAGPELERAKGWIAGLADNDYERREAARIALMGLRRSDLPALREAVRRSTPLMPSQSAVLREIVTHVYLSGDLYVPDETGTGFLGVTLALPGMDPEQRRLLGIPRGVAVLAVYPGFASYRFLQPGDVILAVSADGGRGLVNTIRELQEAIQAVKAGETVKLDVLRQGQVIAVAVRLDARPLNLSTVGFEELSIRRANEADDYWERQFAPLLGEKLT